MHRLFVNECHKGLRFGDLFAGGGGVTTGALAVADVQVVWALNHSKVAIECHAKNHPETKHYQADIRTQDVSELEEVDVLWASTECTQHSKAKGNKNKEIGSYTLGWEIPRYITHCKPMVIHIENVPEFLKWGPIDENGKPIKSREGEEFNKWVEAIKGLGYPNYEHRFLNAADFGCPTRRLRYFGIFTVEGVEIKWPKQTHQEKGLIGLKKWVACRGYLNLENEGVSIFGREFNMQLRKQHRKPLCPNTLRRIAGGIKRFAPEMYMLMTYHGSGHNCHSIDQPIATIGTVEAKVLISFEKMQFITDHCHTDNYNHPDEPLNPQLTRETKQLATIQFISKQYNSNGHPEANNQSIDQPIGALTTEPKNQVVSAEASFISHHYGVGYNQSLDSTLGAITTKEKIQFISAYFNAGGKPESQNQSIERPLNTILTSQNKKAIVTAGSDLFDFDVKMRFLNAHSELGPIMGFPTDYFEGYSGKVATKMIGNAVPTQMARALIGMTSKSIEQFKEELIYL